MSELMYKRFVDETFRADGTIDRLTVNVPDNFNFSYDVIDVLAKERPDKRAIQWVNDEGAEKCITFKDLSDNSKRAAAYLASLGIGKGDAVLLILKRHYQFWYVILALHRLGAVGVPATNQLMKKDIVYRLEKAHIKAVVCTAEGDIAQAVDDAAQECGGVDVKLIVNGDRDGWRSFDREYETYPAEFARPTGALANTKDDIMLMYFTSGTSGYPKVCMMAYSYPLGHIVTARYWHNVNTTDAGLHLTLAETGWAKSIWGKLYGQFLCESAVFVYDFNRFHPTDVLHMIEKYRITTLCAPPTIFRFLIQEDLSQYDFSSLEYVTTAGEAINPEVFNKFLDATGLKLMEAYGQTETTLTVGNFVGTVPREGSMGKPSPQYDVDIVDDAGNSVAPGVTGEIVIRTDKIKPVGLFAGYFEDAEKTRAVYSDNVYHTNDLAWRDEDGYYYYVSRKDDVIKSSGYRIGPFEIESVLMEHPAVLECAVTGVPDPVRGQVGKATIVLSEAYRGREAAALKKEIQEFVKHTTAPYKYPRVVDFVTELPKTISGKIKRNTIRGEQDGMN